MSEAEVTESAFELMFAFDEIVALGYRENVNISQIRTFIEMVLVFLARFLPLWVWGSAPARDYSPHGARAAFLGVVFLGVHAADSVLI